VLSANFLEGCTDLFFYYTHSSLKTAGEGKRLD